MAGTAGTDRRIVDLLEVDAPARDLDWLKESLQTAVELELATIPVYLCGMWSIKGMSGDVFDLIKSVVMEEMLHLGLACNMLKALQGSPKLRDRVPAYPCQLPGGVGPGLTVYLAELSKDSVKMFMDIERPEHPLARRTGATHTIGDFYDGILAAFQSLNPSLSTTGQQASFFFVTIPGDEGAGNGLSEDLGEITSLSDVEKAIATIKDQGEGSSMTPDALEFGQELAHFYRFGEIFHGKRLKPVDGGFEFAGDPVLFPDTLPVAKVPPGGYPNEPTVQAFDKVFTRIITGLEAAWDGAGSPESLANATTAMTEELPATALAVVTKEIPGDPDHKHFGPDFRVIP